MCQCAHYEITRAPTGVPVVVDDPPVGPVIEKGLLGHTV